MGATALWLIEDAANELLLFAAAGLLIGGLDDLLVDLIWIGRAAWRSAAFRWRWQRVYVSTLPPPEKPGPLAVFIGAWDESSVIGQTLRTASERWRGADLKIYVGLYPNDPSSWDIVSRAAAHDPRIVPVSGTRPGPTTKAEALNRCFEAMCADEIASGVTFKAVMLHDAEDQVHADEPAVFGSLIERFDFIQLPVMPLVNATSRWVAGHYQDEFAEAHGKQLIVREAVGAGVPAAGTGCAIYRSTLQSMADRANGCPFDDASLTEDYDMGIRLALAGWRPAFVRVRTRPQGELVAVRAHFPERYLAAVRQKARWVGGIALAGWDNLGWAGGLAETWMRLRDRRAPLAALVLAAGYLGFALLIVRLCLAALLQPPHDMPALWRWDALGYAILALTVWRIAMRAAFVTHYYGWREGLWSIPRLLLANTILIASVGRALWKYLRHDWRWDKTDHSGHPAAAE